MKPIRIRLGHEIAYAMPRPTPMIFALNVHYSRVSDLLSPDVMHFSPAVLAEEVPGDALAS